MKNHYTMIVLLLVGCQIGSGECCDPGPPDSRGRREVQMSLKTEEGMDLLNPNTPDYFSERDMSIYYVGSESTGNKTNGLYVYYGYSVPEHESEYRLRIAPHSFEEDFPVTYIKWNMESDLDTLKCQLERENENIFISKAWFNGVEVWDINIETADEYDDDYGYFEIIK